MIDKKSIMFIKQMQSNHRLPLAQIKLILEQRDKGREVTMELTRVARALRAYIFDRVFQKQALSQEFFDGGIS